MPLLFLAARPPHIAFPAWMAGCSICRGLYSITKRAPGGLGAVGRLPKVWSRPVLRGIINPAMMRTLDSGLLLAWQAIIGRGLVPRQARPALLMRMTHAGYSPLAPPVRGFQKPGMGGTSTGDERGPTCS